MRNCNRAKEVMATWGVRLSLCELPMEIGKMPYLPIEKSIRDPEFRQDSASAKKLIIVEEGARYAAQNPVPAWLEMNFDTLTGRVLSLPKRKDINLPINEQLIVELYSK